jgi:hypothetical protein
MTATAETQKLVAAMPGLRTVPPRYAVYDAGTAVTETFLRMPPQALTALAAAGLPHRDGGDGAPLFDFTDLTNLALRSGLGTTVPELARRFLLRFVTGAPETWYDERTWRITVAPPKGGDTGWQLLPVDADAPGIEVHESSTVNGTTTSIVTVTGRADAVTDPAVIEPYEEILAALVSGDVVYQTVSEPLRDRYADAWRYRMADCVVVSRLLAARVQAAGPRARARRGYLLGLLGSDHAWTEVYADGRWQCLDPVFELLAAAAPDTGEFQHACRGSRFNRLVPCATETAAPLVSRPDRPTPGWALADVSSTLVARPSTLPIGGGSQ